MITPVVYSRTEEVEVVELTRENYDHVLLWLGLRENDYYTKPNFKVFSVVDPQEVLIEADYGDFIFRRDDGSFFSKTPFELDNENWSNLGSAYKFCLNYAPCWNRGQWQSYCKHAPKND